MADRSAVSEPKMPRGRRLGRAEAFRAGLSPKSSGFEAIARQRAVAPAVRDRLSGRDGCRARWRNMDRRQLLVLLRQVCETIVDIQNCAACEQKHLKSDPAGQEEKE